MDPETTFGWVTEEEVRGQWADAPLNPDTLSSLLMAAHAQCLVYAPALGEGATAPDHYRLAQILQARELFSAFERDGDVLGFGDAGYAVRVRPLAATVKALLRPRRAVPVIG